MIRTKTSVRPPIRAQSCAQSCALSRGLQPARTPGYLRRTRAGFTLLEVLVVMGIIAMLTAILIPSVSAARHQAQSVVCRSNIRQIAVANDYYSQDFGVYVAGAPDFLNNLHRWHGTRDALSEPFDSRRGPLVPYPGPEGAIRQCPTFPADDIADESGGFERGNGGYGYNNRFLGVQLLERAESVYDVSSDRSGAVTGWVRRPADTIMFTDSAFAASGLIEYSFAEPRFHPQFPGVRVDPSIHFRHRGLANVAWCDGHVDAHERTFTASSGLYRTKPESFNIGWFGRHDDNRLFDLK